jgi:hypothetical protein
MGVQLGQLSASAKRWQERIVSMRAMVAFIAAEICDPGFPHESNVDIHLLVDNFIAAHGDFCMKEHQVFFIARQVEIEHATIVELIQALEEISTSFDSCIAGLDDCVRQLSEGGKASVLLNYCGADILTAVYAFKEEVKKLEASL